MKWVTGGFGLIPVRTSGRFGPIPFWSGCCGLILEVGVFVPILVGTDFLGNKKFFWLVRLIFCSFNKG